MIATRICPWLSLFAILIIFQACAVNKIHCGAFYTSDKMGDSVDNRNFIVKNDGTKIHGEKITYQYGLLLKEKITVDRQEFKTAEVRAFQLDGDYHARLGNKFVKRIIRGKLNVYLHEYTVYKTRSGSAGAIPESRCAHYAQNGDTGKLVVIANQKGIRRFVADCPRSVAMIDQSSSKIRKAIRRDRKFLNKIFENYNAENCSVE